MATKQLAMVINLDKCIGCQGCTVTCRTHRLNRPGCEMLYYIWVETKPGKGWPRNWMEAGRKVPDRVHDYGGTWTFDWKGVYESGNREKYLRPIVEETGQTPTWGPIWEEDQGAGQWPNGHFFYMPRLCNHCSNPPCVKACEEHAADIGAAPAMSKRESDGIVMIDPKSCDDCGVCVAGCPYKIPMSNLKNSVAEMCDFCVMRVEKDYAPVCAKSCPARAMLFGYLDDKASYIHKLVKQYKVALPLRPGLRHGAERLLRAALRATAAPRPRQSTDCRSRHPDPAAAQLLRAGGRSGARHVEGASRESRRRRALRAHGPADHLPLGGRLHAVQRGRAAEPARLNALQSRRTRR